MRSDIADYTVVFIHETPAAVLVTDDGTREVWLPKSKIEIEHTGNYDHRRREVLVVSVPEWLAKDKGLA
ncbi:hypothetical protein [Hyphomonas sp.]|uniref:hypothetical protein n=1 Tax=Hyphomonas sp. TaxID=87 RepID=UPI0025BA8083|nr:hypothetical protein [Hyphomonas sp.]